MAGSGPLTAAGAFGRDRLARRLMTTTPTTMTTKMVTPLTPMPRGTAELKLPDRLAEAFWMWGYLGGRI